MSTLLGVIAVIGLLLIAAPAVAQEDDDEDCTPSGMNGECNEWGEIAMENREEVRGEPVDLNTTITLSTSYEDRGARWIMFSVRNTTADGESPVSIRLNSFATDDGEVVTTRVVHEEPNELNLWVDVLDLPVDEEIEIDVTVGVTEAGAFSFETLVLAFDRGYDPVQTSSGEKASLFSFTLLGVNEPSEAVSASGGDSPLGIRGVPGFGPAAVAGVVATVAATTARRWDR